MLINSVNICIHRTDCFSVINMTTRFVIPSCNLPKLLKWFKADSSNCEDLCPDLVHVSVSILNNES